MPQLHRVVAVATVPQSTFELGCIAEVFGINRPGLPRRYSFQVCAESPGPVHTRAGYDMHVEHGLEALGAADSVFITGWPDRSATPSMAFLAAVRAAHARGARIAGICSGTFALAATGLLDGRTATTHWRMAEQLAAMYPQVLVEPRSLYVDHGDVATSAGTGAAIDLALQLVRTDLGAAYAADVARHMVVPPHRDGGQAQYSRVAPQQRADLGDSLAAVLEWAGRQLGTPIGVEDLAARAAVSPRTLARIFERELGVSPGRWLLRRRIDEACIRLERTDATVESIAVAVGLSSASNMRRRFGTELGTTPHAYRRTFTTRAAVG